MTPNRNFVQMQIYSFQSASHMYKTAWNYVFSFNF